MRIITRKRLREFARRYPDAAEPLQKWYRLFREAEWHNLQDVRRVFPHADAVTVASGNTVTVFNICGNKYRLVVWINYEFFTIYVRFVGTHKEYDEIDAQTI